MDFNLTDEQDLLRDGLTKFLASRYDLAASRTAAKTGPGWQPEIWRGLADELGILGATLPEDAGGSGGGPVEAMLIAEALGHALLIEPFVDTVVVAGGLLHRAGGAEQLLAHIVDGSAIVTLAAGEPASGDNWRTVTTTAQREGDGWVLDGSKVMVLNAPLATHLLITARTSGDPTDTDGISLFLVEIASRPAGLTMHPYRTVDDRRAADLVLQNVRVPAGALLGGAGQAWPSVEQARDEGAAAVCAEAVGAMRKVLGDTVEYCKQRHQFGTAIGSFQALQHRMVDMHMEVEQAAAAVYLAVLSLDSDAATRAKAVSAAKATIGRAARFVGQNAVQLHGGMGMTEELAIGHYFKRLTAVQYEFGSTDSHVSRYADLTRP
ncbi:acyl-CoA dehydrogenase family protein [Mycolicibacterium brisbanense]|uniref:Acyl-CoA dehydrogenase n=1 Tax=Mycolicibacterium brisbanense TaxID=146020 RepID=A0A100VYG0_9MYCO|nr:acyl-CoA dehydrogenase family protein [Mycolicibacterium brisbanense]MCV7161911.1 acyl-CoA dehydrogenase family protein [Mycolicibacterium brisbanense]GAS88321.1 acyl-CoA dehydrogenase [Mycolicibacterium brisbanense]